MKKRWAFTEEFALNTFLFLGALLFVYLAFGFPGAARQFPLLVGIPLSMGLAIASIVAARIPEGSLGSTRETWSEALLSCAWMVGLIAIIWLFGLMPSMFLIPFIYMRFYCGEGWRPTLAISIGLVVVTYFFMKWMQIPDLTGVLDVLLQPIRSALGIY
jgi:hypothetical protein